MGAIHKMAPVGVCGALLHTGPCWIRGKWKRKKFLFHYPLAGCMAGCVRSRKTRLRRATFCSFCLNTLRVILTDDLCVRRTWKIKPEKELEQDFLFSDRWQVSSAGLRTTYNTADWLVQWLGLRLSAASDGFVFPTEKGSTPSALAVLVLCLRLLAFVTVQRPPRVWQSDIWLTCIRYMCSAQRYKSSETAADVQRSIVRPSNLTKRKSSWRLKKH